MDSSVRVIILSLFITSLILFISIYYLEININCKDMSHLDETKIKDKFGNKYDTIYDKVSRDYVIKTNDITLSMNNPTPMYNDTCFINPNVSIREARSNFVTAPIVLDSYERERDQKYVNRIEKRALKKINELSI